MNIKLPFPTFNLSIEDTEGNHYIITNLPSIPAVGDAVMVGQMSGKVHQGYVSGRRLWYLTDDNDTYAVHIKLSDTAPPVD